MKKIFAAALIIFTGMTAFAQDNGVLRVKAGTEKALAQSKETGVYEFQLPTSVTAEEVAKNSAYYTQYFTVDFDAKTSKATLTMVNNDEQSRHVVLRFLISNNIKEVDVNGKVLTAEVFFTKYMK